jgi:hypothetical protein
MIKVTSRKPATESGVLGSIVDQYVLPDDWKVVEIIRCGEELTYVLEDGTEVFELDLPEEFTTVST